MGEMENPNSEAPPVAVGDLGQIVADSAPILVLMLDLAGRVRFVNPFFQQLTGWSLEEARGADWVETFIPKRDRERIAALLQSAAQGRPTRGNINPILTRSGDEVEIEWNHLLQSGPDGQPTGVVAIGIDVTARVRAEEAYRRTADQLNATLAAIPDLLFEVDGKGRILSFIAGQQELLALAPNGFLGRRIQDVLPRFASDACLEALSRAEHHGAAVGSMYLLTTPKGERWFEPSVARKSAIGPDGARFVLLARDVTARREAEEETRASRRKMREMLDGLFAFVGLYSLDGILLDANRAPFEASVVSRDEAIGKFFWETYWWSHSPEAQAQVRRALGRAAQGETVREDFRVRLRDDLFITLDATFGPLRDETGRVVQIIGSGVDVTARKTAEDEVLRNREALRESEARLNEAQHLARIGSWELDLRSGKLTWSDEIFRIFEIDPSEFRASYVAFLELVHPDERDALDRTYTEAVTRKQPYEFTHRLKLPDGRIKHVHERAETFYGDDGRAVRSLGTVQDVTERMVAAEALRESEDFSRTVLDSLSAGIAVLDERGDVIATNESWRRFARENGASETAHSFVGTNYLAVCRENIRPGHDDGAEAAHAGVRSVLNGETEEFSLEYPCHSPVEKRWYLMKVAAIAAPRGGAVVSHENITPRIQAELRLREGERLLQETQRIAQIGSWTWNFRNDEITFSPEINRIFGIDPGSAARNARQAFLEYVHPDDRAHLEEEMRNRLASGNHFLASYRVVRSGGEVVHIESRGEIESDASGPFRMVGSSQNVTDRMLAEQALRESGNAYWRVVSHISDALIVDDLEGRIVFANSRFLELYGLHPNEAVGMKLEEYVAPEWHAQLRERHDRRVRGEEVPAHFEYEGLRHDGTRIWLEATVAPVVEGGRIVGTQSTLRDVSDRKRTDDALHFLSTNVNKLAGEAFYSEIAAQLAALLGVEIGFIGRVVDPGRSRLRTIALSIDGIVAPPEEFDLPQTPCELVLKRGVAIFPENVRQTFPSSSLVANHDVSGYAGISLVDSKGGLLGVMGVMTRSPMKSGKSVETLLKLFAVRTSAEMERQKNEERFENLFEASPDGFLIVDGSGRITLVNRKADLLFGYSRAELLEMTVEDLIPKDSVLDHASRRSEFMMAKVSRPMGARGVPLFARRKDGTTFRVAISLSPIETSEGEMVVAAVRDISEQVRADQGRHVLELQLRQAQKLEAIGTLASGIAHDFNNILGVIAGHAELTGVFLAPGHKAEDSLGEIQAAAERGRELVRQILQFGRKQPARKTVLSLRPVVDQAVRLLRTSLPPGVELSVAIHDGIQDALANVTQIHQVVTNLAINAFQSFEGRPGRVEIELAAVDLGALPALGRPRLAPGRYTLLTVRDTGKGMDTATLERIYEPFFTTKDDGSGSGLGLAVVHGIVEEHGGAITVDSKPNEGTTFRVYLPIAVTEEADKRPPPIADRNDPGVPGPSLGPLRLHLLMIDDELPLVSAQTSLLELQGFRVTGFTRPTEALAAFRAEPDGFDIVVTDFSMPESSGLEITKEILRLRPAMPIIVVSGHVGIDAQRELLSAGVRRILDKPCSAAELAATVRKILEEGTSNKG